MRHFRFTIRELLLAMADGHIAATAIGWWIDHRRLSIAKSKADMYSTLAHVEITRLKGYIDRIEAYRRFSVLAPVSNGPLLDVEKNLQ